ncbi:NAD(P)H:quinone oxidoreductase [Agaribacter marinus]|uniref:NAD(P)H quinone oxidoreductase n=1 Tax=Agaribacter marinus TaxID=1431249 RepID=A0AA37SXB7_9ALTE|nr:NAD(P)H:quinone oxidoreductase [Agaribacter marinus]GLR69954.1 NAD(P)H quinone oxidoreductase [Agaribacter marinus]
MTAVNIVVLYYSKHGSTFALAEAIARGAEQVGANVKLRTVPPVSDNLDCSASSIPNSGYPYISKHEIETCDGLALGSPTHFGNMAAPMKYFWDTTSDLWLKGSLVDKPACVFSSSSSMHGGQESTLLSMMLPLFHHGMLLLGLPYSEPNLHDTKSGGTPYGVTSVVQNTQHSTKLSDDELSLAIAMGKRLATTSKRQIG